MAKLIKLAAIAAACIISAFSVYCLIKNTATDENTVD